MDSSPVYHNHSPIRPARVRYIKLGRGGMWEHECLEKGVMRLGFDSASAERFSLCIAGQWDALKQSFLAEGKDVGTATRFTNETQAFFEDDGTTLWITFVGVRLCWGRLALDPPEPHDDQRGVWRRVVDGWRWTDLHGDPLTKDRLSGALTQLAAYRGTSCGVYGNVAAYAIRRINGEKTPEVERALAALEVMRTSALELLRLLGPQDFELLVDLVFSTSGWRRLGVVGKTEKTLDIDLMLPSTGERAFVQVKSSTTQAELDDYVQRLQELGMYNRMFYVFHSGRVESATAGVTVIGPEKLAELVIDAGLVRWLIDKVS